MKALPESERLSPTTYRDVIGAALATPGNKQSTNADATSLFPIFSPRRCDPNLKDRSLSRRAQLLRGARGPPTSGPRAPRRTPASPFAGIRGPFAAAQRFGDGG